MCVKVDMCEIDVNLSDLIASFKKYIIVCELDGVL